MTGPDFSLEGKIALITGSSRGIGRAIALTFAEHGADVALAARGGDALEEVAKEVRERGRRALAVPTNLTSYEEIDRLGHRTLEEYGGVDILVNNAATVRPCRAHELQAETFEKVMRVNVWAPLRLAQICRDSMKQRGGGAIVNGASNEALRPSEDMGAYPPSKAALVNFGQILANEWGPDGIRVNSIACGLVRTRMGDPIIAAIEKHNLSPNPLGIIGEPEDLAGIVLLLASDAGRYCTGSVIQYDAGEHSRPVGTPVGTAVL